MSHAALRCGVQRLKSYIGVKLVWRLYDGVSLKCYSLIHVDICCTEVLACFRGGRMMRAGEQIRLPDDCTIGYIISKYINSCSVC